MTERWPWPGSTAAWGRRRAHAARAQCPPSVGGQPRAHDVDESVVRFGRRQARAANPLGGSHLAQEGGPSDQGPGVRPVGAVLGPGPIAAGDPVGRSAQHLDARPRERRRGGQPTTSLLTETDPRRSSPSWSPARALLVGIRERSRPGQLNTYHRRSRLLGAPFSRAGPPSDRSGPCTCRSDATSSASPPGLCPRCRTPVVGGRRFAEHTPRRQLRTKTRARERQNFGAPTLLRLGRHWPGSRLW